MKRLLIGLLSVSCTSVFANEAINILKINKPKFDNIAVVYVPEIRESAIEVTIEGEKSDNNLLTSRIACEHPDYGNYLYVNSENKSYQIESVEECYDLVKRLRYSSLDRSISVHVDLRSGKAFDFKF